MENNIRTGYFADTKSFTKVHLVDEKTKPICGSKVSKNKEFQFCGNYPIFSYIECDKCKEIYKKRNNK